MDKKYTIAVDGYEANAKERVGIGRYAFEILHNIYKVVKNQSEIKYNFRIYLPEPPGPDMPKKNSWWTYKVRGPKKFWTLVGLPWQIKNDTVKPDIIFSPTHYCPRFIDIAKVISVMDLSYLKYPEMFRPADIYKLTNWTRNSIKNAAQILTISKFSRNAIIKAYSIDAKKVSVTYPGFSMIKRSKNIDVSKKYGIEKNFILAVGTLQPRKNFEKLIEAFAIFTEKNRQPFGKLGLVIIGKKGWKYETILEAPGRLGISGSVHFLDYIPDSDLPSFYMRALCFCLPSFYEGFGLPVLEAMAYSCPVVVSNVSSLPEIAAEAGIYVDPEDSESIARGLLTAVRQRNLMQGKMRIRKGLERVDLFTWEKAARQTLDILESTIASQK